MTWADEALCRGVPGWFHPTANHDNQQAMCAECPVTRQCAISALGHGVATLADGVWAGVVIGHGGGYSTKAQRERLERIAGGKVPQQRRQVATINGTHGAQTRQKRERELRPCPSPAAYGRHYRNGEQPCDACKALHYANSTARRR